MTKVSADNLQKDWANYLKLVESGETLIILRADEPVAEVRPLSHPKALRPHGLCAGAFLVPDDFDVPLPDEVLAGFEGR